MKERMGYDLHQFIISPLHDRIIPSLNVPHPHLQWGVPLPNMFLTVTADTTGDQPTLDTFHGDLRRARGAASSMVPTSTGAAKAVGLVLPELAGKLDGAAIRVPTSNVSLIDLKFIPKRPTTVEEINSTIITAASNSPLKGILGTNDEPLVSIDFNHNSNSSTFDLNQTQVIEGGLVRVLAWYDNEWGFSTRMSDTAAFLAETF